MTEAIVRDATGEDLEALAGLRGPVALHRDRLRDAARGEHRYLVIEDDGCVAGFAILVFDWPESWPPIDRPGCLPRIIDLFVDADRRGRGLGGKFIDGVSEVVREAGGGEIWIAVDPVENPRARALYERLGFVVVDPEPRRLHWKFTDSDGNVHEGRHWNIDLVRQV